MAEAAALKTPTIAYDVPGLRDSVKHMETGVLVRPGDVEGLAAAITTLLRNDPLRTRLAENAHRMAKKLSWEETAKQFLETISQARGG